MSVTKVVLGKLSPTMEEGTIVKWAKKEGDQVKVGDIVAEIETDKANMEMEALGAGILRKVLVPAGAKAPVGTLIGVIADPGDDIAALLATAAAPAVSAPVPPPKPAAPEAAPAPPPIAPVAAAAAPAAATPAPAPPAAAGARVKASPLARAIANDRHIDIAAVHGSGPSGRIIRRDVEAYTAAPRPAAPQAAGAAPGITPGQEFPLSNMRKTIAKRLSESKFTAPHFYVSMEIGMEAAVALREQLLKGENQKVSFNDLVVKACAKALARFPMINASWAGDRIVTHAEVHVGVAVSIPDGLIVPVVRNADHKSVLEISREVRDLATRARDKKLRPEEFMGSTFSVSNLGMMDVTEFTAIINPPESAILAVGSVRQVPVVRDGTIGIGHRMKVTLSSDHRVVDGALAAQFLGEVKRLLENPVSLFI